MTGRSSALPPAPSKQQYGRPAAPVTSPKHVPACAFCLDDADVVNRSRYVAGVYEATWECKSKPECWARQDAAELRKAERRMVAA